MDRLERLLREWARSRQADETALNGLAERVRLELQDVGCGTSLLPAPVTGPATRVRMAGAILGAVAVWCISFFLQERLACGSRAFERSLTRAPHFQEQTENARDILRARREVLTELNSAFAGQVERDQTVAGLQ